MNTPGHEFLLYGTDEDTPADSAEQGVPGVDEAAAIRLICTALAEQFAVRDGIPRRECRVWLDTHDHRLRGAGLRLAYVTGPAGAGAPAVQRSAAAGDLLLVGAGCTPLRQPATARWPSLLDALPAGPVRERLAAVVGVRALLPLAEVAGTVRELALLNTDEKTVARVRLDHAGAGAQALPARITLTALRGYTDQAELAAKLLTAAPGVTASPPDELALVVPAAPARRGAWLRPDQDATEALAVLLAGLLDEIEANTPGTIDDIDTEFLHDLRVAVRRTRSALKLAGDALPAGLAQRFAGEFRWLGELTTPVRDLDTLLLGFDALARELADADAADLEPLRAYLRRQRGAERRRLVRGLRSARFVELTSAWRAELSALAPARPGPRVPKQRGAGTPAVAPLAAARAARAWRQVARRGAVLVDGAQGDAGTPPEALHDLRKRCKELRYVLELFGTVWDPETYRDLVRELKMLQDTLGEFQDAEVHRDRVREYAVQMAARGLAGVPTLLAMGELVARLGARQRAAAACSVGRVSRFVTDANRRRVAALVRAR